MHNITLVFKIAFCFSCSFSPAWFSSPSLSSSSPTWDVPSRANRNPEPTCPILQIGHAKIFHISCGLFHILYLFCNATPILICASPTLSFYFRAQSFGLSHSYSANNLSCFRLQTLALLPLSPVPWGGTSGRGSLLVVSFVMSRKIFQNSFVRRFVFCVAVTSPACLSGIFTTAKVFYLKTLIWFY